MIDVSKLTSEEKVELLAAFTSNELMHAFLAKCNEDHQLAIVELQRDIEGPDYWPVPKETR
jgi:hypothetical protein